MTRETPKVLGPAREEYSQLRAELTSLLVSERTAWLAVITTHVAVGAILAALLAQLYTSKKPELLDSFVQQGWLVVASDILLIFQIAIASLADRWLREAYNLGSYLVVFHERRDPGLEWITRNRSVEDPTLRYISYSPSFSKPHVVISFLLGILPAVISLVEVEAFYRTQSLSFYVSLGSLVVLLLYYYLQFHRLNESGRERARTTTVWEKEWNRIHRYSVPVELQGYRHSDF